MPLPSGEGTVLQAYSTRTVRRTNHGGELPLLVMTARKDKVGGTRRPSHFEMTFVSQDSTRIVRPYHFGPFLARRVRHQTLHSGSLFGLLPEGWARPVALTTLLQLGGPESGTGGVCESKQDACNGHHLEQRSNSAKASVGAPSLLDPLLLALLRHTLELEVACVSRGTGTLALDQDEHNCANDRNEVQRQIHDIADDGTGGELGEGLCCHLSQSRDWVAARLDLAVTRDQS